MKKNSKIFRHNLNRFVENRTLYYRKTELFAVKILLLSVASSAVASDYFDPALLRLGGVDAQTEITDLSHFEAGSQAPGNYRVSLYVNNDYVDDRNISFISDAENQLVPQFTVAEYRILGLRTEAIDGLARLTDDTIVENIRTFVPAATSQFAFSKLELRLSFPQMLSKKRVRGEVDAKSWDHGMPAALLNYALTGNQTRDLKHGGGRSDAVYANLRAGLNAGAWRLRSYGTYQQRNGTGQGSSSSFDVISTYLQRDIHAIKGQLTLGDSATPGDVFDSVQFQGGQLLSDDSMLPDSLRGFAPVIRGVSESGAEISVRQNGSLIYQSYVPPGPFEISDLYPTSLSGDLVVTVKESDGSERTFTQPYSSIAVMQREGRLKYAATIGRLRSSNGALQGSAARFVQGTLVYGLPGSITVYGGAQLAKHYLGVSMGAGVGLGRLGAVSADVTHSDTILQNGKASQGQSYRLRYSRSQIETGTTVSLAAYRYSTEGYYNLQDAFSSPAHGVLNSQYRPRGELQVMLSQSLASFGSLYVSGSQRRYWNKTGELLSLSMGYNTSLYGVNYGLNFTRSRDTDSGREDHRLALTASVPLGRWLAGENQGSRNTLQANYGANSSKGQGINQQVGLSGSALEDNQLNYSVSQSVGDKNRASSLNATYRGSAGTASAGFNRSQSQEQVNYGLTGGIVAHPYGVTLAQELGESSALVRAPGAGNVKVNNQSGLYTDGRGYAVLPSVQPYRRTDVSLNPQNLGANVALNETSRSVVPTRGAVVLADFPTQRGHQVMMTLRQQDNTPVPFGASVRLVKEDGEPNTGIVGDEGLLFISGMPDKGRLEVHWGRGSASQCSVAFDLLSAVRDQQDGVPLQVENTCKKS